jgi:hypothetical protein
MNKTLENNLWIAIQKMRGKADLLELNHMMLYALLFKHQEMVWDSIADSDNEIRQELFKHKMGHEYVALYPYILNRKDGLDSVRDVAHTVLSAYEEKNHIDSGILYSAFDRLIHRIDAETIISLFSIMDTIQFESYSELYDLAEYLILRAMESLSRSSVLSINPTIAKLEAALLDCRDSMTLYDGFCGTGISVNKIASKGTKISMQDLHPDMVSIASILCILGGKNILRAGCDNALWNTDHDLEFDRVIAEPPFGAKFGKEYAEYMFQNEQIPDKNIEGEGLVIFHVLNFLKDQGLAAVLIPTGFLFKGGKALNARKILLDMNVIDAIFELPEGCLPGTYVPAAILILKKARTTNDILMIDTKSLFRREKRGMALITDEGIAVIAKAYNERTIKEGFSAAPTLKEIVDADYGLSVAKYVSVPIVAQEKESIEKVRSQYAEKQSMLLNLEKELESLREKYV